MLLLIVLCRVIVNPVSNVFQKILTRRGANPLWVIVVTHALLTIVCLPLLLLFRHDSLPRAFWLNIGIVAILTVASNALLVAAVRLSDLSVLGPVNAYKSIISLIPAAIVLHEHIGPIGALGMALIVGGSYFIVDKNPTQPRRNVFVRFFTERGVQLRFAAMTLSAIEAVFLKEAFLSSWTIPTFAFWAILGFIAAITTQITPGAHPIRKLRSVPENFAFYLLLAASTGLMQFCTIVVLGKFQVGYALALFQISTLVSVILGHRIFKERNVVERLLGSVIMMAGAILIILRN